MKENSLGIQAEKASHWKKNTKHSLQTWGGGGGNAHKLSLLYPHKYLLNLKGNRNSQIRGKKSANTVIMNLS